MQPVEQPAVGSERAAEHILPAESAATHPAES